LFHLQTLSQHGQIDQLPARGVATCRVPCLPLVPGRYELSFNCTTLYNPGDLDWLDGAVSIDIEGTDYFGTGYLPLRSNGSFLVKADWDFSSPAESDRRAASLERAQPVERSHGGAYVDGT